MLFPTIAKFGALVLATTVVGTPMASNDTSGSGQPVEDFARAKLIQYASADW